MGRAREDRGRERSVAAISTGIPEAIEARAGMEHSLLYIRCENSLKRCEQEATHPR